MAHKFVLEWLPVMQLLGDDKFYETCPEFLFMYEMGKATYDKVIAGKTEEECSGCSGSKQLSMPAVHTFGRHVKTLYEWSHRVHGDVRLLENLRQYLEFKTGYRPAPVVMYHKDKDGGVKTIEF